MIPVQRDASNKPAGFEDRRRAWARDFRSARRSKPGLSISQYWKGIRRRLQDDAQALFQVFSGKCAFCEAKMAHVSSPHVEHYRPKSDPRFEDQVFRWENWLLSCGRCNGLKWAHFPDCDGVPCLLDPTADDPGIHMGFVDHAVIGTTRRGDVTVSLLGLDRSPLEGERALWLMQINTLLLLCMIPKARPEARALLIWSMQRDAPFTAMVRAYVARRAPKLVAAPTPQPRIALDDARSRIHCLIESYEAELRELV